MSDGNNNNSLHNISSQDSSLSAQNLEQVLVIAAGYTPAKVTDVILDVIFNKPAKRFWFVMFGIAISLLTILMIAAGYLLYKGVGIWGIDIPVGWGFAIINFVWWIGIGHAGTLISAFLLLMNQSWRTSINRFAEAMTIFAVMCAGLFPILHLGRPWLFYWLMPYPSTMQLWPQFRSPLIWDVFAVSTYATVSLVFWYVGLLPDLATLRDRSVKPIAKLIYGIFALGWRGEARHWQRYETAYVLLAGLSTPLVLSVHTIVSFDFAVSQIPGWHSTIFPPYFVAGAIFSGFAMVLTIAIPLRSFFGLKDMITAKHLDNMAKVMLCTGLIVGYGYIMELYVAWFNGNLYERFVFSNRILGPYAPAFASLIFCNILTPQLLWFRKVRSNPVMLFILSIIVNIGMWLERFVIVITSLHRDFVPSSWGMYYPTVWDWMTYLGTIGFFLFNLLLFVRFLPVISIAEMRLLASGHKRKDGSLGGNLT